MFSNFKVVLFILLANCLVLACTKAQENNYPKSTPVLIKGEVKLEQDSPKKAYVKIENIKLSQHPLLEPLVGKIVYDENLTSRVSSPVAGRVVTIPVQLGTILNMGSTLLELDSPDVADAESDYNKAEADFARAKKSFMRQDELFVVKAISQKDLEQAQYDFKDASSELERSKDKLKNLHINPSQADGRYRLQSPIYGLVVERNVNPGIEVRPDQTNPLFVISDIKKLTLLMEVYESNISKIRLGQRLSVSVPAYPNEFFSATVKYIGHVLDENTHTVQVRCELLNIDERLMPGMYATINVESNENDLAVVIPLTAVFTEEESDYVFIALDETHFLQRAVEIGLRLKDKAVVKKGLSENERLVTEGALMLRTEEEVETNNVSP